MNDKYGKYFFRKVFFVVKTNDLSSDLWYNIYIRNLRKR